MLDPFPSYQGNTVGAYASASAVAVGVILGLYIFKHLVRRKVRKLARATPTKLDDLVLHVIGKTKFLAMVAIGVYAGARSLKLPPALAPVIEALAVIVVLLQMGLWGSAAIAYSLKTYRERKAEEDDPSSLGAAGLLAAIAKLVTWSIVLLLVLDNIGLDITTLVAGLGIGGIAVALAVQGTLKDLFASVSIMLDKPFEVGDSIKVGNDSGTVEYIGIKTTRVRAPSGEELVFSNNDLLGARIRNFRRLRDRRASLSFGVRMDTPVEKLEAIPDMVRAIIEDQEHTRFQRAFFTNIGATALEYEANYFMTDDKYETFLTTQQAINLEILRRLQAQGVALAYPTQTVHVEKSAA